MISLSATPTPVPSEGLTLPSFSPETLIIFLCVLVIGYSLGWLVSHATRRLTRWLDDREELRKQRIYNARSGGSNSPPSP